MECWAAYKRGQADALALDIINTSGIPISALSERLRPVVHSLLEKTRATQLST
jgi:hypothetical protein